MARTMRNVLSVGDRIVNNILRHEKPIGTVWTVYEFDEDGDAWVRAECGEDSCININESWREGWWTLLGHIVGSKFKLTNNDGFFGSVGDVFEWIGKDDSRSNYIWAWRANNKWENGVCVSADGGKTTPGFERIV